MAVYEGGRFLEGTSVTVDGIPRPPRHDLANHSETFEWTYEGAGPRQLALAILAHHLDNDASALQLHEQFMNDIVANLDNSWQLTSELIDRALQAGA